MSDDKSAGDWGQSLFQLGGYDMTHYRSAPLPWHSPTTPIFAQVFQSFCTSCTSCTKVPLSCSFASSSSWCFWRVHTPSNHVIRLLIHPAYVIHKKHINIPILWPVPHFAHLCAFLCLLFVLSCLQFGIVPYLSWHDRDADQYQQATWPMHIHDVIGLSVTYLLPQLCEISRKSVIL